MKEKSEKLKDENESKYKLKIGVVVSRFNEIITEKLLEGAKRAFEEQKVDFEIFYVPGSFEIPITAKVLAKTGKFDSILTLGCLIKGETFHFEYVSKGLVEGLVKSALETETPIIFGVLTVENLNQALERAGGKHGNKGYEWALNSIYMAKLMKRLKKQS
jgi:6,7-dimethyl-8-ribityllumazine synthase